MQEGWLHRLHRIVGVVSNEVQRKCLGDSVGFVNR